MSNNNSTTFGILFEDVKSSMILAKNNMLSYFLAHLGLAVLMVVMLAVVAVPILAIALAAGPAFWVGALPDMALFATNNPLAIGGLAILVLVPLLALFLIFVGSIFGMSKEVVETGETRAESAFSWWKNKFLTFAGVGVMLTLIIIVPQLIVGIAVSVVLGFTITAPVANILLAASFVYTFITMGLTLMVFPAVVNGKSVQDAFKESFQLATQNFERVFGIHTAIVVFYLLLFSPVFVLALGAPFIGTIPPLTLLGPLLGLAGYVLIVGLLTILVFLPMTYITYTKVYHDLTGGKVAVAATPEVPMF
ncbi:MAG: hypothetical protein ACTSU3_05015 [Candidatus Thorarchaeota archaeon]